jgi:uncharacterized short protein YbdD (DUF466 family)
MICDCSALVNDARRLGRALRQTANLMVGLPDYDAYVAHRQRLHPDEAVMTREEFVRERQARRYGRGGLRCC